MVDEDREAVKNQLAEAVRENERLRKRLDEASIFLEAPPSQHEQLMTYAKYIREKFRDLSDCVNREAVRGFVGAGNKAEPVVNAMSRALEYIGVDRSQMKDYVLFCVSACRQQAKRFFKAKEKGRHFYPPARGASWGPEPQETDFSQVYEEPIYLNFVQSMSGRVTKEKGNLFSKLQQEAKEKRVAYLADKKRF